MTTSNPRDLDNFVRAGHTAELWLSAVAHQLGTDDRHYAYRVLRGWLHTVRDPLAVSLSNTRQALLRM
jgi:uncharacterized protein (DUF2267 family)